MKFSNLMTELADRKNNKLSHLTVEEKQDTYLKTQDYLIDKNVDEIFIIPIEEMVELTQHLTKCLRRKEFISNDNIALLEELVDVQICIDFLKTAFHIEEDLLSYITDIKINRIQQKIDENTF